MRRILSESGEVEPAVIGLAALIAGIAGGIYLHHNGEPMGIWLSWLIFLGGNGLFWCLIDLSR